MSKKWQDENIKYTYKDNIINKKEILENTLKEIKNINHEIILLEEQYYCSKDNTIKSTLLDKKNILKIEIKKLNRKIGSLKCSITNSLKTIRRVIGNKINEIDHNVLLLLINYIDSDISLMNLLLTNKSFNNIIINEYENYILIFKGYDKNNYNNKNKNKNKKDNILYPIVHIINIPKSIFINNNITLEQIFYIPCGKYKCTILHYCGVYNNIELLKSIYHMFPNLNINCPTTLCGWCPIHYSLNFGFSDISILLFNIGIDYNYTTLNKTLISIETLITKHAPFKLLKFNELFNNSMEQFTKKTEFNYNILQNDTYFMDNIMTPIHNIVSNKNININNYNLKIIGLNK